MESKKKCVVCNRPGISFCVNCTGITGDINSNDWNYNQRWYCSDDCQETDRGKHGCEAMARQVVMQKAVFAAYMVRQFFYAVVENTWTFDFSDAYRCGDNVIVTAAREPGPRLAGGWFVKYGARLETSEQLLALEPLFADRNSVWAFVAAHHAITIMFETLCEDVATDIKEVVYTPKKHLARTCVYRTAHVFPFFRHDQAYSDETGVGVYEVTLKTGDVLALDICSMQFTNPPPLVQAWDEYQTDNIEDIVQRSPLGTTWRHHCALLQNSNKFSHLAISTTMIARLGRWLDSLRDSAKLDPFAVTLALHHRELMLQSSQRLLWRARSFLRNLVTSISAGLTRLDYRTPAGGIHRPDSNDAAIYTSVFHRGGGFFMNVGGPAVRDFDWHGVRAVARDSATQVPYAKRKAAREMLDRRCLWSPWGDHRIVFVKDQVPQRVKPEFVSVNPYWEQRRRR